MHEFHALVRVLSNHIAEVLVVHQGGEAVIIEHNKGAVRGVHPFDGEFHCAKDAKLAVDWSTLKLDIVYSLVHFITIKTIFPLNIFANAIEARKQRLFIYSQEV